ncbi:MAG: peptidoglycan LD-endopeptidase LytH [Gaiellaceae bacterium]|nr:peptidoglycan LD-endopeptidase LytH [Gaiellaceae bacterium]
MRRSLLIPALAAACALVLGASESSADRSAGSTARAWAIRVIVPGEPGGGTRVLTAPDDAVAFDGAFSYPADGSIVTSTSITTSVSATSGTQASAGATAQVTSLALFKDEIVAEGVTGETHASAGTASASGDVGATGLTGLVVLGTPVTPTANQQIPLADWGYAIALEQKSQRIDKPTPGHHDFVTALDVFLTADHGGLPAQSEIQIGYAEANAQASEPPPLPKAPALPTTTGKQPPEPKDSGLPPIFTRPLDVTPKQNGQGYVFPVYGNSSYIDTYGAARGDVSGGWHHGDDIFAPLGAPLLAVAHGTVFSVGWNKVGGWRLWLRDDKGWEYYYAHLSAYSPLAVNGAVVSAGDVLGFVGNTGDAQGTPYHLHFEVHPVQLLGLGYDGAVNPTKYLDAWRRLQDIRFDAVTGWTPANSANAPKAGAILLQSSDISSASGLDPASLERAMSPSAGVEGGLLLAAQQPAPKPVVRTGG